MKEQSFKNKKINVIYAVKFLVVALMIGSLAGCAHRKQDPWEQYSGSKNFSDYYGKNMEILPDNLQCKGSNPNLWHSCYGRKSWGYGDSKVRSELSSYVDGKSHGLVYYSESDITNLDRDQFHCEFYRLNGVKHGWENCYSGRNFNFVSKRFFSNGFHSTELEQAEINNQSKDECAKLGFNYGTQEMGNCVLRLRELKNSNQPVQVVQPASSKPSSADQLEGLANILLGVQGIVNSPQKSPDTSNLNKGMGCFKTSEHKSGFYKTCVYKCVGGQITKTVGSLDFCPIN